MEEPVTVPPEFDPMDESQGWVVAGDSVDPVYPESPALAGIQDVQDRYEREIEEELWRMINKRLGDAERLLMKRIPDLYSRMALEPDDPKYIEPENVKMIESEMILRLIRNPEGYSQESDGNYSYAIYQQVASGLLEVTDRDWEILGVSHGLWTLAPSLVDMQSPTVLIDPAYAWGINVPMGWVIGGRP